MSGLKRNYGDIGVELLGHVGVVEIRRPPHNFFDAALIREIADAYEELDGLPACRAVVLAAQGQSFCAGADFAARPNLATFDEAWPVSKHLYKEAVRMFRARKPVVAAVQGAAVGGGLGLALSADFRVTCKEARFSSNFVRIGLHPGFGLTVTLPRLVGAQKASLLMLTGRRIGGDEAVDIGLADVLVPQAELRDAALALAREIAEGAPLAILSIRETIRRGLADAIESATERELFEQEWLRRTHDFKEGVAAYGARRPANFTSR